jgi:hypothetical protein
MRTGIDYDVSWLVDPMADIRVGNFGDQLDVWTPSGQKCPKAGTRFSKVSTIAPKVGRQAITSEP